mmetsp:Transcript_106912/g.130379  ORF Transcript_106912/g.130379 Transcript_106912/m.130379 type:complete len:478 (-) Transcript_106912:53-1486(-)
MCYIFIVLLLFHDFVKGLRQFNVDLDDDNYLSIDYDDVRHDYTPWNPFQFMINSSIEYTNINSKHDNINDMVHAFPERRRMAGSTVNGDFEERKKDLTRRAEEGLEKSKTILGEINKLRKSILYPEIDNGINEVNNAIDNLNSCIGKITKARDELLEQKKQKEKEQMCHEIKFSIQRVYPIYSTGDQPKFTVVIDISDSNPDQTTIYIFAKADQIIPFTRVSILKNNVNPEERVDLETIRKILTRMSYGRFTIDDARLYVIRPANHKIPEHLSHIESGFNKDNVRTVNLDDFAGFGYLRLILRPMYFILKRFRRNIKHGIVFLDDTSASVYQYNKEIQGLFSLDSITTPLPESNDVKPCHNDLKGLFYLFGRPETTLNELRGLIPETSYDQKIKISGSDIYNSKTVRIFKALGFKLEITHVYIKTNENIRIQIQSDEAIIVWIKHDLKGNNRDMNGFNFDFADLLLFNEYVTALDLI